MIGHPSVLNFNRKIQKIQILFDLKTMHVPNFHGLLFSVFDLQQLFQRLIYLFDINAVEDVRRLFPVPAQILRG